VTEHLAALEGQWCPAPDLAAAYALASGVPLEIRHGRRDYQRAIPYAPRAAEEAVYRACRVLADSGVITWSRNAYGLFMDSHYRRFPPWRYCYRDPSFPATEWPPPGGESWRERCRTPLSVAGQVGRLGHYYCERCGPAVLAMANDLGIVVAGLRTGK
jgi:hypothetical protein